GLGHATGSRANRRAGARAHGLGRLHLRAALRRRHRVRNRGLAHDRDRGLRPLHVRREARARARGGGAILDVIERAVDAIRRGKPVVLPMDTVYGLVATAVREDSVRGLYRLKGRRLEQPTALIAPDLETLCDVLPELRGRARAIAQEL